MCPHPAASLITHISSTRFRADAYGRPTVRVDCKQILELRSRGHSLQQIATDLGIGYGTVRARLALAENPLANALQETNI